MRRPSLASFLRLPATTKALAVEAAAFLALARFLVVFVRLRRWRHRISTAQEDHAPVPALAWKVSWVVRRVADVVSFTAVCLQQAIAAQWMLRWRGVASQLTVGVRPEGRDPAQRLAYHAWLQVGGECVVGCEKVGMYTAFPPFETAGQRLAG